MKYAPAITLLMLAFAAPNGLANTSYNLGGIPAAVQVQVADLQKDAELIGMTKSRLTEIVDSRLRKAKIRIENDNGKVPGLVVKATTIDVGPRLATHVTVELKELARLQRMSFQDHPRFVTSWSRAKMVASEPTKHEALVLKAVQELLDEMIKAAHE